MPDSLPHEILVNIFSYLCIRTGKVDGVEEYKICLETLNSASVSNRQLHHAVTPALYHTFDMKHHDTLNLTTLWLFLRTLSHRTDLAPLVRGIALPKWSQTLWDLVPDDTTISDLVVKVTDTLIDPLAALPDVLRRGEKVHSEEAYIIALLNLCTKLSTLELDSFREDCRKRGGERPWAAIYAPALTLPQLRHFRFHNVGFYLVQQSQFEDFLQLPALVSFEAKGVALDTKLFEKLAKTSNIRRMQLHQCYFNRRMMAELLILHPALVELYLEPAQDYSTCFHENPYSELSETLNTHGKKLRKFCLNFTRESSDSQRGIRDVMSTLQEMTALEVLAIPKDAIVETCYDRDINPTRQVDVIATLRGPTLTTILPTSLTELRVLDCGRARRTELDERICDLIVDARYSALQSVLMQRLRVSIRQPPAGWRYEHVVDQSGSWEGLFRC